MGLEQYAGMDDSQKLTALLVKVDNLERRVVEKPCPSPECLACRKDIADLKLWQASRIAQLADEADREDQEASREAWVVPMWVSVLISAAAIVISLLEGAT